MSNVRSSDTGYAGGLFGSAVTAYAQAGGVPEDMVYIIQIMRIIYVAPNFENPHDPE